MYFKKGIILIKKREEINLFEAYKKGKRIPHCINIVIDQDRLIYK
jgi:hypothetical protein